MDLQRPLISFDLETTGVDTNNDRIVEIALVKRFPDGTVATKSRRLNPRMAIPKEATAIHGITDADVTDCPTFPQVARSLADFFSGCDLTGYNIAGFDIPLLQQEFKRCGIDWPDTDVRVVDAFSIYRLQEPHNLTTALRQYCGRDLGDAAHSAEADAVAALDVLLAQSQRYAASTLDELYSLSRDPDWIDSQGKLKWVNGKACLTFGKWSGKALDQIDYGYLEWVLKQSFAEDFKQFCRDALAGEFPRRRE